MRTVFTKTIRRKLLFFLFTVLSATLLNAQITITAPVPGNLNTGAVVVFGIRNTNASSIVINNISNYLPAGFSGSFSLWYRTTSATGVPNGISTANGWLSVGTPQTITTTAAGITPIFTGLSISIPGNTTYRFAISGAANSIYYGASGTTPNKYESGGVEVCVQNNTNSPGYAGTVITAPNIANASFIGSITFSSTIACTKPPVTGTAIASVSSICTGTNFSLNLSGNSIGTGQSYKWESSTDGINWSDLSPSSTSIAYTTSQTATTFYRAAVTCTDFTAYSSSVQVINNKKFSGTYTINSALPTGGTNFNKFADAVNAMLTCGIDGNVIFNVVPGSGPYNEQVIIPAINGTSATSTVTFNGNGETLSSLSTNTNERAVIKLNGADYITFNDLVITAKGSTASEYGYGVHLLNNADNNTFNNCTITVNKSSNTDNYNGIVVSSSLVAPSIPGATRCDNNTFSNNIITGGRYGVVMVGNSGTEIISNNQIINNTITEFYNYGVFIGYSTKTLIENNMISRPTRTVVSDFYGIYFSNTSTRATINRNTITNPFGGASASTSKFHGIYFSSVGASGGVENVVSNNKIYNLTGSGNAYGIYNTASTYVKYLHNTISMDGSPTTSTAAQETTAFLQNTVGDGVQFKNNIITITRGGLSEKLAIYLTTNVIESDYNVIYISSATGINFVGYWNTVYYKSITNWYNATGLEAHSLPTNPVYKDWNSGDLEPQNAAINDKGIDVLIDKDFNNTNRSKANPDLGAYEFTPPACVVPPTTGVAAVSETPICVASPVLLTVSGNSNGSSQTYQWQYATSPTGTFFDLGDVLLNPDTTIQSPSVNMYYRLAVTCSGQTSYSDPVLLTINQPLPGGNYTINKNIPASDTNYQSFMAAKNAMACGITGPVVFDVAPNSGPSSSPYNEQLILDSIRNTSEINTVTFKGNGNTIKYSSGTNLERAVIKFYRADYITIDSLLIDATGGTYGYGVQFIKNADSNIIRRCTILTDSIKTGDNQAGIVINASASASATFSATDGATLCDYNTIENNSINGGNYGITVVGITDEYVNKNRIFNNKIKNFYTAGIYLSGTSNTLVEGNEIWRPTRTSSTTAYGIYAKDASDGMRISKNRVHNPFDKMLTNASTFYGIDFNDVDASNGNPNIVSNNLVYNFNGTGTFYGLYNNESNNALYYHNTISLDNNASISSNNTNGFYQINEAQGIELKNNLFTISRGGTGSKYGLNFNNVNSQIVSDYNNVYLGSGTKYFFGYFTTDRLNLNAWQTATNMDLNSSAVDPQYISPVEDNFKPLSQFLDNHGTRVGLTTDIDGNVRNLSAPDIGAYEFAMPQCTTPPLAGAAAASPSSGICMGTPIRLSLSGNSFGTGITCQWEYASAPTDPFLPLGNPKLYPDTVIEASTTLYYRAAISCSGVTQYSTPVKVTTNDALMADDYTIDPGKPAGTPKNFPTFAAAIAQLECGIAGPVTFHVAPGTYTEQVRMHRVPGATANSRVTFQSENGDPASVILNYNATVSTKNYVLQLDSASYITFKDMTITALNTSIGRVIEIANTASYDSLVNLRINAPVNATASLNVVGIYAPNLKGGNHVIKGNTITNGSSGIYLSGISDLKLSPRNVIDSNTINATFNYGIYTTYNSRLRIHNNTVNLSAQLSPVAYGISIQYVDTAYQVTSNKVTINNTSTTISGISLNYCDGTEQERGTVAGNTVLATTNNTGNIQGLVNFYSNYNNTINNVVSINTTGNSSSGLHSYESNNNYYNNSIYSTATSDVRNVAGYFYHKATKADIRNNIFAHNGGGMAIYTENPSYTASDYNLFYTNGPSLVEVGKPAATYANLKAWREAYMWDVNSIVYKPAFMSETDLQPNLADPEVWAMHGRGVQIAGNDYDFNNRTRPTTLTTGVPDLGAFEFLPTATPPVLTAIPATPVAGGTQVFMMGTDTVSKITWRTTVPTTVNIRRYSGILPPGLTPATPHMYYYTEVETTGTASAFTKKDFYIDSWQGWINHQYQIRLGKTDASNNWLLGVNSSVDTMAKVITEDTVVNLFRYTGLADVNALLPVPPAYVQQVDSSNMGKRFWVAYANSFDFNNGNEQDMVLYLSTGAEPATVTVKVNGTSWVKTYTIPANTAITTDKLPKAGFIDSRLLEEGKSDKGISIESDVPIVAYAHIYYDANSGASMLLPVGTYGYEYYALSTRQNYMKNDSRSSFFVVADRDNTTIEITPSNPTMGGRSANVPFVVTLNRGEVYQVLGAYKGEGSEEGFDLTGSKIKSIPNTDGKCYPIAVFAGSSRTRLGCNTSIGNGGDLIFQQVFPSQAWGKRYLTAPTSIAASSSNFQTSIYRVMVKDPTTQVKVNGNVLAGLVANRYYEFESISADYVEADKPVMVAQIMASSNSSCMGSTTYADGDPELFYVSPIEQAVNQTRFYRNNQYKINVNYLTLIIPTNGLASLTIDGSRTFNHVYAHPNLPGYSVVVKRWGNAAGQSWVQSDSAFTGIVYGEGLQESYGYNVGTLVKNLNAISSFTNTFNTVSITNDYTCTNAPFKVSILVPVKPALLIWNFSKATGITPNADVVLNNPEAIDSVMINDKKYYKYVVNQDYSFGKIGTYTIPVSYTHPEVDGCNNTLETALAVKVVQAPLVDFTVDYTNCIGDVAKFNGAGGTGVSVTKWNWNLGDGNTAATQTLNKQYTVPGSYNVNLKLTTAEGCLGDTTKKVAVNPRLTVDVVKDSLSTCLGTSVTYTVKNPSADITYKWFNAASGGTLVGTGSSFTATVNTATNYYVEAVNAGCAGLARKKVIASLLPDLSTPVVTVDSASVNLVRFKWNAVPGATSYDVSEDNGNTWIEPSANNLTHTISGLRPLQSVTLTVKAKGGCKDMQSLTVSGKAQVDQVYIPNSFSPNGDGLNDVLQVYGFVIKGMQFQVFNQWGEKIYESKDQSRAWDGTHKNKMQPSGVYLYVCKLTLNDGSVITRKGSVNLVR